MAKKAALLAAALLLAAAALDVSGVTGRSVLLESSEEAEGKYSGAFGSMHALEKEAASFGSGGAAPISSEKARSTYDAAFGRLDALQKFADQVDRHDGVLGRRSSHRSKHHAKHAGESLAQRAPAPMRAERHRAARGRSVQPTFKALDPFNEGVVMPPGGEPAAHGHLDAGREVHLLSHKGLRRAVAYARVSSLAQVAGGEGGRAKEMVDALITGRGRGGAKRARTISLAEIAAPAAAGHRRERAGVAGVERREAREMVRQLMEKRSGGRKP
eukprot:CAMPEP_0180149910 /NCGR_PEP_ID=MMETSP0986-20121125/21112_1 /TAXON_ID=697907 /ORGANISM="non described non described, Strain CCMP2293" /LENGTH=271 /DNA_ID=CAMNT_0022096699 /DNA_START=51 /DNA_END=862 /DNA_ORIENTATION=+